MTTLEQMIKDSVSSHQHELGYRLNETPINMEDEPLSDLELDMAVMDINLPSIKQLKHKEAMDLVYEALSMRIISTNDVPPFIDHKPSLPDSVQIKEQHSYGIPSLSTANPEQWFLVELDKQAPVSMNRDGKLICDVFGRSFVFDAPKELADHLANGYCAFVSFSATSIMRWLTVPEYYALEAVQADKRYYKEQAKRWGELYEQVDYAKQIQAARDQQIKFAALPFEWTVAIKPVMSGLGAGSMGNATKSSTVVHLVTKNNFSSGKLSRQAGEYLCSQPDGESLGFISTLDDSCSYPLQYGGHVVERLPYTVTCKECHKRIERLLSKQ